MSQLTEHNLIVQFDIVSNCLIDTQIQRIALGGPRGWQLFLLLSMTTVFKNCKVSKDSLTCGSETNKAISGPSCPWQCPAGQLSAEDRKS